MSFRRNTILYKLASVANSLDRNGLQKDADTLDEIINIASTRERHPSSSEVPEEETLEEKVERLQAENSRLRERLNNLALLDSSSGDEDKEYMLHDEWVDVTGRGPAQDPQGFMSPGEEPVDDGRRVRSKGSCIDQEIDGMRVEACGEGVWAGPWQEFQGVTLHKFKNGGQFKINGKEYLRYDKRATDEERAVMEKAERILDLLEEENGVFE